MSSAEPDLIALDCLFDTVVANLIPYYLTAAKGDENIAARTILQLIKVYEPVDAPEIELAGRIVGFAAAAADNLRLSMRPGLSDAKVLRFRTSAATLDRSAEKCRTALAELQARRYEQAQQQAAAALQSKTAPLPTTRPKTTQPGVPAQPHPFADMASELAFLRAAMNQQTAPAAGRGPGSAASHHPA